MERTIKFQLSNLKTTFFYSALIAYGFMGLALLLVFFVSSSMNQSLEPLMFDQPVWLLLISIISVPFTFTLILYAFMDGLMFFDTSLRFGISRKQYFINQVIIYLILSLLYAFATGLTEVEWTNSVSSYFSTIGANYLTIGYIVNQFIRGLLFVLLALGVYRFKLKAFIIGIIAFFIFMTMGPILAFRTMGDSAINDMIMNLVLFIIDYQELFVALLLSGMLGLYYRLITKTEVQD
ncbi:MAG: hypothetical protein JJU01_09310 [Alkalibacterium sp.]|nr:hypothetical protein [Alkalibacterium sp.]